MIDLSWYDIVIYYIGIGVFIAWGAETIVRYDRKSMNEKHDELNLAGFVFIAVSWLVVIPMSIGIYLKNKNRSGP